MLQNVLFSLKHAPSMTLLESLFIFSLQERPGSAPADIRVLQTRLSMAENALIAIRDFNREVPLTLILRCITGNMGMVPRDIGGGEDWFVAYREYWKRQVDEQLTKYKWTCQYNELVDSMYQYFSRNNLKTPHYVASKYNPTGFPVQDVLALSFLMTFYSDHFVPDIFQVLRTILIEGEFDRPESQTLFTEVYNNLIQFDDVIRQFELRLSPEGEYGKHFFSSRSESDPLQRRRVQRIIEEASQDARGIVDSTKQSIAEMIKVLEGFVRKAADGNYDVLVTRFPLSAKSSPFVNGIGRSLQQFQRALQFLDAVDMLDSGKRKPDVLPSEQKKKHKVLSEDVPKLQF
jgi:hypothetical protein